jgi:hypothetical protein
VISFGMQQHYVKNWVYHPEISKIEFEMLISVYAKLFLKKIFDGFKYISAPTHVFFIIIYIKSIIKKPKWNK